jgi:hypothetical protein
MHAAHRAALPPVQPCPAPPAGEPRALLLSRVVVINMPSGEAATFACSEWLRSSDPFDFELDASEEQARACCCCLHFCAPLLLAVDLAGCCLRSAWLLTTHC